MKKHKDNQPKAPGQAQKIARNQPPLFASQSCETGHGRLDQRTVKVFAIEPLEIAAPSVRALAVVEKTSSAAARPGPRSKPPLIT